MPPPQDLLARAEAMHVRYLAERYFGESIPEWFTRTPGRPPALPVCPLCRTGHPTHAVKGTDRRVCNDCADGIPSDMQGVTA